MCFNDFVQKKIWKEKYGSALIIEWQQCFQWLGSDIVKIVF